jgi:ATP-dependent helicase HepA
MSSPSLDHVGQRCVSEREPELGLGVVAELDRARITVEFPATRERRIYARGTPVLKRVRFGVGETVAARDGAGFAIEEVVEEGKLLVYVGGGRRVREDQISDVTSVGSPVERLLSGQADPAEVFDLRLRTLRAQARLRQSEVRGFLGGRLELIPHQFYILHEVSNRQIPRVLLADEVGLGKTIEACLILQRLLVTGRASRALVLVPEPLLHQWFVELLRRFNLWFTLFDERRCLDCEAAEPEKNPFLSAQLGLAATSFLAGDEKRAEQVVAAGWDLVIVDEAHHLGWTPGSRTRSAAGPAARSGAKDGGAPQAAGPAALLGQAMQNAKDGGAPQATGPAALLGQPDAAVASPDYALVEKLAAKAPGLLLLTATPTQLGQAGHFARLRLLDPNRYDHYESFLEEAEGYAAVAGVAEKLVDGKTPTAGDRKTLTKIFDADPERLAELLGALEAGRPGAREALVRTLLDQHGTGRVVFRNTRAAMSGFPKRKYLAAPVQGATPTLLERIARELEAEEAGDVSAIRYAFKDDPRIDWLVEFLKKTSPAKVLLICRSERKLLAIEAAVKDRVNFKIGLFHEGLPLVQRDRQAAWFAEPDGAQLLLCSEIGSEGRNFQFAHHLVLWDLPLNPGVVEQRIGRLDRIGQTETIKVHVPYVVGGADECVAEWYHRGLGALEAPLQAGDDYHAAFKDRLLALAIHCVDGKKRTTPAQLDALVQETQAFHAALTEKLKKGRDRLLELNSFDRAVAERVLEKVRAADADPFLKRFLGELLDHFGVRVKDHEEGDLTLDANHAYVEGFPSIPRDGMLATFDRRRAITREDIRFLSADHPLVQDTIDLLVDSPAGTTAFCTLEAKKPNLLLEAVFVLETVADAKWQVDRFLAPTPVRVLLDIHGRDLTDDDDFDAELELAEDAPLPRFLEKPGFNAHLLKTMVEAATEKATERSKTLKQAAREAAATALTAELQRLVDLSKVNDHVSPKEIELAKRQVLQTRTAIEQARLRLDSLRMIVAGG